MSDHTSSPPEAVRTEETRYLLLGHPAWPGNLSTTDADHAEQWFNEHRGSHPVYVDVVHSTRLRRFG